VSAQGQSPAGAFRQQDAQILRGDHARDRWDSRCRQGWEGYNLRAAWREGIEVDLGGPPAAAYRFHVTSGMIVVSNWGFITTAYHLRGASPERRSIIREVLRERDL
jgi:hypothetical protein